MERVFDSSNRPKTLDDFIGQDNAKRQLKALIAAAREWGGSLEHLLLLGEKGLGKSSLALALANTLNVPLLHQLGGHLTVEALNAIVDAMTPHCIVFIDEIHRLTLESQERLYLMMEDGVFMMTLSKELPPIRRRLKPFTLVGATTREGQLSGPFRDRFGARVRLTPYTDADLAQILWRDVAMFAIDSVEDGVVERLTRLGKKTPRIAKTLLRRVIGFSALRWQTDGGLRVVTQRDADAALQELGVDANGLEPLDRRYLGVLQSQGGCCGLKVLAASLGEDEGTLEDAIEPWLLREGFVVITPRGRVLTREGAAVFAAGEACVS